MTPRSLFVIIMKVMGIILLEQVFNSILQAFAIIRSLHIRQAETSVMLFGTAGALVAVIIYCAVFYILVFKPDIVINKLQLDEGFYEESFTFNMDHYSIINIGIIIVSLYFLIDNIPDFLQQMRYYFQTNNGANGLVPYLGNMVFYFVKIIIGYVMLTNSRYITNYIIKKNKIDSGQESAPED